MLPLAMIVALGLAGSPPAAPVGDGYPIKVYFWQERQADPMAVTAVRRWSPDLAVARHALEQLLAGPTAQERTRGLRGGLRDALKGPSNCGQDFDITIRHGVLTVRFCRYISVTTGTVMTVAPQVESTLRQFPTVRRVVLLGPDGHCTFTQKDGDDCLA